MLHNHELSQQQFHRLRQGSNQNPGGRVGLHFLQTWPNCDQLPSLDKQMWPKGTEESPVSSGDDLLSVPLLGFFLLQVSNREKQNKPAAL